MTKNTTHNPLGWIAESLTDLENQDLRRHLSTRLGEQAAIIQLDGWRLVNFGSNDYLGLAADPRLTEAVAESLNSPLKKCATAGLSSSECKKSRENTAGQASSGTQNSQTRLFQRVVNGWGAGASPLITGRASLQAELEKKLAEFEGAEAALLFTSGFAANISTIAALVGVGDVVFCDAKNHASIFDGCRLSRADVRVYPHCDYRRLDRLIERAGDYRRRLIVTDSIFSMDGDAAPLGELAEIARRRDAMLMVDEAHATGVFGERGRGLCEHLGVEEGVHVRMGTLSKALGSIGGFVAGSRMLIDWLVNRGRAYIYSTAQPAAIAAAGCAALEIVRNEPHRRSELLIKAEKFRSDLTSQGWNTGSSTTQIVPIIVGDSTRALTLSAALRDAGFFVPAIRPPTVPQGEACLRVSLCFHHTEEQVDGLLAALKKSSQL